MSGPFLRNGPFGFQLHTPLGLAIPLLWTAYLLAPVEGWGVLDGLPLGPIETAVLAGVWWLWGAGHTLPGRAWLPAGLLIVKLAGALLFVPQGFEASYFANPSWTPPHERSLEYPRGRATRLDRRLAFGKGGAGELPLHFFHDNSRFNVGTTAERNGLPFSVQWSGYWRVYDPGPLPVYVAGTDLDAAVIVDGGVVLHKPLDAAEIVASVPVAAGWRELTVRVSAPHGRARAFQAGTVDVGGARQPFGVGDVFSEPVDLATRNRDAQARVASTVLDAATIALVAALVVAAAFRRARAVLAPLLRVPRTRPSGEGLLALVCAAALIDAIWFGWQIHGRVVLLLGGDDMLTYATQARDIVLDGALMTGGQPPGAAEPFYYQPLYPYVLALTHRIFGEDMFGIFVVQRLGVWVTVLAAWRIGGRLFGARAGWATLAVAAVFAVVKLLPWSSVLLGETVFIPLVSLSTWALVALAQGGGWGPSVAAGVIGGLATLSRSTLMPAWAVVLPMVGIARRRRGLPVRPVAGVLVMVLFVVGMATVRNWVASGRFVPIATSFPVNFELGNPLPGDLSAHDPRDHAVLRWWPADERTTAVLHGAWHAPMTFAENLLRKALYTLGFFEAWLPGRGWSPFLVATWLLALAGVWLSRRLMHSTPEPWIPAALAAMHFAAVTLIFPHAHGDRLILPFYVLLLPYAGAAVAALRLPRYD